MSEKSDRNDRSRVNRRYFKRIAELAAQAGITLEGMTREQMLNSIYEALANKAHAQHLVERIRSLALEAQLNLPPNERSDDI